MDVFIGIIIGIALWYVLDWMDAARTRVPPPEEEDEPPLTHKRMRMKVRASMRAQGYPDDLIEKTIAKMPIFWRGKTPVQKAIEERRKRRRLRANEASDVVLDDEELPPEFEPPRKPSTR